jgi:hypothetical protein
MGSVPISRCEHGSVAEFHGRYHLSSGSPTWLAPTATIKDLKAARTLTFDDEFAGGGHSSIYRTVQASRTRETDGSALRIVKNCSSRKIMLVMR